MKITKTQLKKIIKEELKSSLGEGIMSLARDLVPGGLQGVDQDLMDKAKAMARKIKARQYDDSTSSTLRDILPGSVYTGEGKLSDEDRQQALRYLREHHIYALILAMKLQSDQMDRVVGHIGKDLALHIKHAVNKLVDQESIEIKDLHRNIQTNYSVAIDLAKEMRGQDDAKLEEGGYAGHYGEGPSAGMRVSNAALYDYLNAKLGQQLAVLLTDAVADQDIDTQLQIKKLVDDMIIREENQG